MNKQCVQCRLEFVVSDLEKDFLDRLSPVFSGKKYQIPEPTLCSECRRMWRMAWRNERNMYHRKCDLSGKQIISMHSSDKPYKVYDQAEWWSDQWDALQYGREFDFSKSFSEQLHQLYLEVPHVSLYTRNVENSYYTNFALNQKNCYLIFGGADDEDCFYGNFVISCKNIVDCYAVYSSEFCYEAVNSEACFSCRYIYSSRNCSDCLMIEGCQSCKDCICCFGLQSKQYFVFNEFVGKEKFELMKKEYEFLTSDKVQFLRGRLDEIESQFSPRDGHQYGCENSSGDNIYNCKNCFSAFDAKNCEDCLYVSFTPNSVSSMDMTFTAPDGNQFCYNVCSTVGVSNSMGTFMVWYGDRIFYSIECQSCKDLFGCVGLKNKQYCIFNRQYSKEEYDELIARIAEHMQKTGEWAYYLSPSLSPFAYNETIAQDYFPLSRDQVLSYGWKWKEDIASASYQGPGVVVPDDIREVKDDVLEKVLACEVSGKSFKLNKQEFSFYKRMGIPVPKRCPDQRYRDRLSLQRPRSLREGVCGKCGKSLQTNLSSDVSSVICQECYLRAV